MADQIKIELIADADGVIKAVQKIGPEAEKSGKKLNDQIARANNKGKDLVKIFDKFSGIVGGIAFGAAFSKAIKDFAEFESRIAEVNTLLPKTNRVTKETEQSIKNLSAQFGKDSADLASAYYDVISAGSQDAAKSLELLTGATKASVVGVTDVKTATGAILSVMNAYGAENINATEASEKLFAIVQQGRTTFPELASSIGDVVPVASQLGIGLDELGGFLAVSTRVSGNTAKSVTQLSAAFNAILKPTDEAKKIIEALNKETGSAIDFSAKALKEQGLQKFLEGILNATKGYKNQQEILAKVFTSTEALKGVLSVTGTAFNQVKESIDAVNKSNGVLDEGFKVIDETLQSKFNKSVEKSKNIMVGLADVFSDIAKPSLDFFNQALDDIISKQKQMQEESVKTGGAYRDLLGRGAIQPETFSPEAAIPFQMGQEGVDPTGALIDKIVGMGAGDAEENPMMQFAVNTDAMSSSLTNMGEVATETATKLFDVDKALNKNKKNSSETASSIKKDTDVMAQGLKNGLANTASFAIQELSKSLVTGSFNFGNFVKAMVGMLGDLAIQLGTTALLSGIAIDSIGKLTGTAAIIAGGALIALGAIMKAFAGGGGGASSPSPAPMGTGAGVATPITSDPTAVGPLADEGLAEEPAAIEKQQQVQLIVQGDILDSEETGTRLLNILNEEFDAKGGRIAYA